ncbi:MAG: neutral zinc metallopeptidase [Mesorhizobium sp.]|uniref:KPN_02809 family neutral zinc metallopeptidase n=1 Tax=unclassified Mesorhizobium TaxID=325217 RepID=UPI000F753595|nr:MULTISPECIES: neutral zinc metallopeptidase [unclassified Mesorhizobium]RVD72610.1 neutral zinc metallopeptidase [Mesorhizobium sp. M4A.F.Ca.ET.029.04.2.1]AZO51469.1 neutral zinc metallopeptidase [Mesorhizobium sp. M4B.F.Ca.ET.058.02.1.1]RUX50734.1 neutral zinc metallopeptidase [Mesorhizobium sp. M4A.F.Ca.ET.050.02.1.1]RVC41631.1 neutral zinc metallopeptidase [Mesorhizobium sp. M4A.F.Ca.ET.090.04.2.1]RWC53120.1 MAG: neutral zinc metallopeptidase [Mesorhizobium sp.]
MLWRGRRQSDNVEDERSDTGGGGGFGGGSPGQFRIPIGGRAGGGSSLFIVILVVLAGWYFGFDPSQILGGGDSGGQITDDSGSEGGGGEPASDEMKQFVSTVLAETEDTWKGIFQANGRTYEDPKLVLFSSQIRSACGFASAAAGPFYCPGDHKVYLDMTFFQQLDQQFGASGEFARAYVIAHEVGHHVQNLTGILPKFNKMRQGMSEADANHMSMQVELQADCFAGVWAHYTAQKGILEQGDIESALNAAKQIGDDTLQKKMQGYVVPESFNHGTSQQRQTWLARGYKSGKLSDCDTFNNPI